MPSTPPPVVRYVAFAIFALAVIIAAASWLVRTRRVSPFGMLGKLLRQTTDPVMRPIERQVVRRGGNPVQAGWWLVIGVAILGVLVVSLAQWVMGAIADVRIESQTGARGLLHLALNVVFDVLIAAIFVRVIASWLGAFRYAKWMRPFYWLTDWLIEPIRRILPSTGMIDFSPLVALLVLWVLRRFVVG